MSCGRRKTPKRRKENNRHLFSINVITDKEIIYTFSRLYERSWLQICTAGFIIRRCDIIMDVSNFCLCPNSHLICLYAVPVWSTVHLCEYAPIFRSSTPFAPNDSVSSGVRFETSLDESLAPCMRILVLLARKVNAGVHKFCNAVYRPESNPKPDQHDTSYKVNGHPKILFWLIDQSTFVFTK